MQVKDYAKKLLVQDCIDLLDAIFINSKGDISVFSLAAMPYICLVVNESYQWCLNDEIELPNLDSKKNWKN